MGLPRGLEGWADGREAQEAVGLAGVRCCSRDQRQGSAGVWRWQRAAVRQIKAKSPVLAVSETGRPCEMRFEHRAERGDMSRKRCAGIGKRGLRRGGRNKSGE